MKEDKINSITDNVYSVIIQKGSTGKMTDLITAFNEVKKILKDELSKEYLRGYNTAAKEIERKNILKQQKEN